MILEASTKCSIWIVTRNYTHRYFVDWYFITFQQEIILKLLQLSPFKLHSNPRWFSLWNIWNFGFDLIEYTHKTQWSTCYVTALLMFHSNKCFQTHNRHDSGSKRNQRKSKRSEQHASVASPNGAGGSGGGGHSESPLSQRGSYGAEHPTKKMFGLQRPLDLLKINSNFINCGYRARQKS